MQIYFSPVEAGDNIEDVYVHNTTGYYYSLELDEECIAIKDTGGRSIVLSISDIEYLMNALIASDYYTAPIVLAEKIRSKVNSDLVMAA